MIRSAKFLALIVSFFVSDHVFASNKVTTSQANSRARIVSEFTGFVPGRTQSVGIHITLADEWHTYWKNPGDSASTAIMEYSIPRDYRVSSLRFPLPKRIPVGPLTSFGYEGSVLLWVDITVPQSEIVNQTRTVRVAAEWLVCREECIPATFDFELRLPVVQKAEPTKHQPMFQIARKSIVRHQSIDGVYEKIGQELHLEFRSRPSWELKDVLPLPGVPVRNAAPEIVGVPPQVSQAIFERDNRTPRARAEYSFLGIFADPDSGELRGWMILATEKAKSLGVMLGFAFLGGLILNLMPCVFPVLTLKFFGLIKVNEKGGRDVLLSHLVYQFGILFSFWILASVIVGMHLSGNALGWGFQMQSPYFLTFLIVLFFALGLNFFGFFHFNFRYAGVGQRLTEKGGLWGSFFTGVLAVVVASPCTAPFMGAAMGYALSRGPITTFLVFSAIGLGLGFPYVLLSAFPKLVRLLPKPGDWMIRLKEFMAFPMWGTAIWLLWIAGEQGVAVWVVLLLLVCLVAGIWVWKSFGPLGRWAGLAISSTIMLVAIFVFFERSRVELSTSSSPDFWEPFDSSKLSNYLAKGQPVFINFTAAWCISCQVNEKTTFQRPVVQEHVKNRGITMMKADWTNKNEEIGRLLKSFGRAGVPLYIFYPSREAEVIVLPEILTPEVFLEYVQI